jgi:hypothetical protein
MALRRVVRFLVTLTLFVVIDVASMRAYAAVSTPPPATASAPVSAQAPATGQPQRSEHLNEWMEGHAELSLSEMLTALGELPGFEKLPAATRQHLRDTLVRLYKQEGFPHASVRPE